jgi:hypothetical protein
MSFWSRISGINKIKQNKIMGNGCGKNLAGDPKHSSCLGLESMELLEYERRVKHFSFTGRNFVTFAQLCEAFQGT